MPYKDDASDEDDEHLVGYTAHNGSSYDPDNTDHGYGDDGDNQGGESEGQMLSSQRMMMEGMSYASHAVQIPFDTGYWSHPRPLASSPRSRPDAGRVADLPRSG